MPVTSQTKIGGDVVPTLAIEEGASPKVSVETICCLTQDHVSGVGPTVGTDIADHLLILRATLMLKYPPRCRSGQVVRRRGPDYVRQ